VSTGSNTTQDSPRPVIEDALRARAEQAESAAERLLELVDLEEDGLQHSIPTSLLLGSNITTPKPQAKPVPMPITHTNITPPVTPINRNTAILTQAAAFKNSPAYNGHMSSSLLDVLKDRKNESGWWLKRMTSWCSPLALYTTFSDIAIVVIQQGTPLTDREDPDQELQGYIHNLKQGQADIRVLQKLAWLCIEHPATTTPSPIQSPRFGSPGSPSPFLPSSRSLPLFQSDLWMKDKNFEKVFNALIKFVTLAEVSIELIS
jgi:CLIP-associating protein 1/2